MRKEEIFGEYRAKKMNIRTLRLLLKPLTELDVTQDYANWLNDPEVSKYLSCGPDQTVESCKEYVRSWNGEGLFGIFKEGKHIGNITIQKDKLFYKRTRTAVIGISIGRKELWGRGLATEAVKSATEYCFNELNAARVHACVGCENLGSVSVFIKSGYRVEGIMGKADCVDGKPCDCYMFARTK